MKRKIIALAMCVLLLLSLFSRIFAADSQITDGTFVYTRTGNQLKISGYIKNDQRVEIPNQFNGMAVTSIDTAAFKGNKTITNVEFTPNITTIGNSAFMNCTSLEEVSVPGSVTRIGDSAFLGCTSLKSVEVVSSSTEIGISAFQSCDSLFTAVVESSKIGYRAFWRCESLVNIELGATTQSVGAQSFDETAWERGYNGDTLYLGSVLYKYRGSDRTVYADNNTRCIADSAFKGADVWRVVLPDTLYYIGQDAFGDNEYMTYVSLPQSVLSVGSNAFGCVDGQIRNDFTVYGTKNSYAERYCQANDFIFVNLDGHAHSYTPWVIDESVDCEGDGFQHRECVCCNEIEYKTIKSEGHIWTSFETITPTSCTSDGIESRMCTVCGKQETNIVPSPGHVYGEWEIVKSSTCTERGKRTHACTVCGKTESEIINKLPHVWVVDDSTDFDGWVMTKKPTCTTGGSKERVCSVCLYTETAILPKTQHNVDKWTVTRAATTYREGEMTGKCSICKRTVTQKLDKIEEKLPSTVEKIQLTPDTELEFGAWKSPSGIGTLIVPAGYTLEKCLNEIKYPGHIVFLDRTGSKQLTDLDEKTSTGVYISLVVDPETIETNVNIIETVVVLVWGDVNGDGKVDAVDARNTLRVSAKLDKFTQISFLAADVDESDTITPTDARKILRVSAKLDKF